MVGCEPVCTTEHGERDLPGCGLALKPALLDPQNLGGLGCRVQRRRHPSASASRPVAVDVAIRDGCSRAIKGGSHARRRLYPPKRVSGLIAGIGLGSWLGESGP